MDANRVVSLFRIDRIRNEEVRNLILPIVISLLLFIIGQIINPGFANIKNIGNILAIAGILTIGAAGQTLVIISGNYNIDLSLGALMSMGAVLGSGIMHGADQNIFITFFIDNWNWCFFRIY